MNRFVMIMELRGAGKIVSRGTWEEIIASIPPEGGAGRVISLTITPEEN